MTELFGILFILTFVLLTAAVASAAIEETILKSYTVWPGGKLTVDINRGSIRVEGKRGASIDVEIIQNVRSSNKKTAKDILDNFQVHFDQEGNDLFIKAEYKRNGIRSFFNRLANRLQVKFIITVPLEYDVDLHTSGGSISVLDLDGEVNGGGPELYLRSSGGGIHLKKK